MASDITGIREAITAHLQTASGANYWWGDAPALPAELVSQDFVGTVNMTGIDYGGEDDECPPGVVPVVDWSVILVARGESEDAQSIALDLAAPVLEAALQPNGGGFPPFQRSDIAEYRLRSQRKYADPNSSGLFIEAILQTELTEV